MSPLTRREVLLAGSGALLAGLGARCSKLGSERSTRDFDVCVVGSGFAGTYLGLRLLELGARVAIVEAGGYLGPGDSAQGAVEQFPVEESSALGLRIDDTRTIGVGGTSRRWNGVVSRLLPADFATPTGRDRTAIWPFGYDALEPFYCAAERALGAAGEPFREGSPFPRTCPLPNLVPAATVPPTLLPDVPLRFERLPVTTRAKRYAPVRLAETEIPRFVGHPGAELLTGQRATRVLVDDRGEARELEITSPQGSRQRLRARCFVLAAGVAEIPRILFASRTPRAPAGLGNQSGMLGANLVAHPRFRSRVANPRAVERWPGLCRTHSLTERLRSDGLLAASFDLLLHRGHVTVDAMTEIEPSVKNRLELIAAETGGEDRLRLRFDLSRRDQRTIDRALAVQRRLTLAFVDGEVPPDPPDRTWFHPAGTCRMASDTALGVVDPDGRVFGTDNVYVAGAALFPTSGSGNPTLTLVALALRLAEHLAGRLELA